MGFSKRAYYVRLTRLGFALLFSGLLALLLFLGVAAGPLGGPQAPTVGPERLYLPAVRQS